MIKNKHNKLSSNYLINNGKNNKIKSKNNYKGFTLVELIITIIILAVLGIIAYISFSSYSEQARDSQRITDLSTIKSALELFHLDAGKYPYPSNWKNITYSGATTWIQGTIGETIKVNLKRIDKIPLDPLLSKEYTYSITSNYNEYELAGINESGELSFNNSISQTNAFGSKAFAFTIGNYNNTVTKALSGTTCYALGLPTIIANDIDTSTDLIDIINNNGLVYNGYNNLPSSYKSSKFQYYGGFDFEPKKLLVYSDFLSCNPLISSESERVKLFKNIQENYTGTTIFDKLTKEITDTYVNVNAPNTDSKQLSYYIVKNYLRVKLNENSVTPNDCESGSVDGYTHGVIQHGQGENVTKVVTISNGVNNYSATAVCDNGTTSIINDTFDTVCEVGYTASGGTCSINNYTVSGSFGALADGATISVCGSSVTADSNGDFTIAKDYGTVCNNITATRTGYTCNTSTDGPAFLSGDTSNIAGSCSINSYNVSGSFGSLAAGADVNVCGSNVTADGSGNFTISKNYGTVCNNITASKIGISCVTNTDGPSFLSGDTTNVAGTCNYSWITIDSNCGVADLVIGTQRWAGCNSTIGTGFEWGKQDGGTNGNIGSCYSNYAGTNNLGNCTIGSASMDSNAIANSWYTGTNVNGDSEFANIWGKLYTWTNASSACTNGRHVPTDAEFEALETYLNGAINCRNGNIGQLCNGLGWKLNNTKNTTNNIAKALKLPLSGNRTTDGITFYDRGYNANLWSSTAFDGTNSFGRSLDWTNSTVYRNYWNKSLGFSVRCIKD